MDNSIPIIGKSNRDAVTLRFTRGDLEVFTDIIEFTQGHRDLKLGLKNIIVSVMSTALQNLKQRAKEELEAKQAAAGEVKTEADSNGEGTTE